MEEKTLAAKRVPKNSKSLMKSKGGIPGERLSDPVADELEELE